MRGTRLLRPFVRCAAVVIVVGVAASGAIPAAADGDVDPSLPYFSNRIGGDSTYFRCIAAGPDGSVVVAGSTNQTDLPGTTTAPSAQDTDWFFVVTVLSPTGQARWTSYVPSYATHGYSSDTVRQVRVASDGAVWMTGDGLVENPGETRLGRTDGDAWIAKFDPAGTLEFASMIGGTGDETVHGLALTPDGDAVVVGETKSADFPLVDPFQAVPGASGAWFVTRVRADGSGMAWSSYAPSAANAVALDASGQVIVGGTKITKIAADGGLVSSMPLFDGGVRVVRSLAVAPSGRVLAGGEIADLGRKRAGGFVVEVGSGPVPAGAGWQVGDMTVAGIAVGGPDDEILVRTWGGPSDRDNIASIDFPDGGALVLTRDLRRITTIARGSDYWKVRDVDVAPDGARCMVGHGMGVPFNPDLSESDDAGFVARLPASGADPPSRFRVVYAGERSVDLAWTGDGDPAVAYEVYAIDTPHLFVDHATRARRVPGRTQRTRISGLSPGEEQEFRLVAVFASGVRTAVLVRLFVTTRPAPLRTVVARENRFGSITIVGDAGNNGRAASYQCQRRVNGGSFESVPSLRPYFGDAADAGVSFLSGPGCIDTDRDVIGRGVAYRMRAVTLRPMRRSSWTYALFVKLLPR